MEKLWKIKNLTTGQIKFTMSIRPSIAPGIILQPNQFCIARQQITAPLDKQVKTKKVEIEEFNNTYNLELGKAYDESFLDKAKEKAERYTK